jgi:hypothetical protein
MEPSQDELLLTFASIVDEFDLQATITLAVGGVVLTGELISFKRYLGRLSEAFGKGGGVARQVGDAFASKASATPAETEGPPSHLHLDKVMILAGASAPLVDCGTDSLWRCGVERVDAFAFGSIPPPQPAS